MPERPKLVQTGTEMGKYAFLDRLYQTTKQLILKKSLIVHFVPNLATWLQKAEGKSV